ncbi:MAG: hypothetical protein LBE74_08890 [Treponema sp.]|jgi:hypothetical protein|nr:hypothetical protein [Treponema sp.]
MKNTFKILILSGALFLAADAVVFGFGIGVGGVFDMRFNGSISSPDVSGTVSNNILAGGGFVALDFRNIELSLGTSFGNIEYSLNNKTTENLTVLQIGLLGKLPLKLGPIVLYPILGTQFDFNLANNKNSPLWIMGGAGVDVLLAGNWYVRCNGLYGIPFQNEFDASTVAGDVINHYKDAKLGNGVKIRLSVGYNFSG